MSEVDGSVHLIEALEVGPEEGLYFRLPCDVMIPPAVTLAKGCPLQLLINALEMRAKFPDEENRFSDPGFTPKAKPLPAIEVAVEAVDYSYAGTLVGIAFKRSGRIRYIVEDLEGRLFVHNASQINKPEGWLP
jgi:hypothetical protein